MKTLQELFAPYELALKLEEKGFDEPCLACYKYGDTLVLSSKIYSEDTIVTNTNVGYIDLDNLLLPYLQQEKKYNKYYYIHLYSVPKIHHLC